jgi:hypothetical protein
VCRCKAMIVCRTVLPHEASQPYGEGQGSSVHWLLKAIFLSMGSSRARERLAVFFLKRFSIDDVP